METVGTKADTVLGRRTVSRKTEYFLLHAYKLLSLASNMLVFYLFFTARHDTTVNRALFLTFIYGFMLFRFEKITGGYDIGKMRISEITFSKWASLAITHGIVLFFEWFLYGHYSLRSMFYSGVVSTILATLWAVYGNKFYFVLVPPLKTIIVYDSENLWTDEMQQFQFPKRLQVLGSYDISSGLDSIIAQASQAEVMYLYKIPASFRNDLMKAGAGNGLTVYVQPKLGDLILSCAEKTNMFNLPVLRSNSRDSMVNYYFIKRVMDILMSFVALTITAPLFAAIAVAIKLDDRGPIYYRQTRLTKDGKLFKVIKFRSMRTDAEADGVARLAKEHDDRVTRVGRFIRKGRLDELPQLINVLRGEMSMVGPRPERPEICEQYRKQLPEFDLRLVTRAGITGYAQVFGKYNTPPYDKLQMDLMYILNQSIWEDLKILMLTVKVLFTTESTQGVEEGNVTAVKIDERSEVPE